jgi:hypothetical protein
MPGASQFAAGYRESGHTPSAGTGYRDHQARVIANPLHVTQILVGFCRGRFSRRRSRSWRRSRSGRRGRRWKDSRQFRALFRFPLRLWLVVDYFVGLRRLGFWRVLRVGDATGRTRTRDWTRTGRRLQRWHGRGLRRRFGRWIARGQNLNWALARIGLCRSWAWRCLRRASETCRAAPRAADNDISCHQEADDEEQRYSDCYPLRN